MDELDTETMREIDNMTKTLNKDTFRGMNEMIDLGLIWVSRYHLGFWGRCGVAFRFVFKRKQY